MNILCVYPEFLVTFWSWKYLLKFISKKAAFPPLGLLTVAAMLPIEWKKKLVDLNIRKLIDEEIRWADYVFVGAMITQSISAKEVIARCKVLGVPVVLGGPILETECKKFDSVSHFLLGEVENTLPEFVEDLLAGRAKRIYPPKNFPDLNMCPIPLWGLINPGDYACLSVQYGRGCPFRCTFCNIAVINGRVPRTKAMDQFLRELDAIYQTGFRGGIMLADDNFIGGRKRVKEMLPELIGWQQDRDYPFEFTTEVDITLADDSELMDLLVLAGFKKVFLGLETPNKEALVECHKTQNATRDMAACVKAIQNHGLHPMSGFIVGFDSDGADIFDKHIQFYRKTGIVFPMIGVLQAPRKTELFAKLHEAGRMLNAASGNNTDCYPNFVPKMPVETLVQGYKRLVEIAYSPREYYWRICVFLREYNVKKKVIRKMTVRDLRAFFMSVWHIGLLGGRKASYYYWKTLLVALVRHRQAFSEAVALQIYGLHFRKIAEGIKKA